MSDMPATSGIYRITCLPTGKVYVGSAVDLRERCWQHRTDLRRNSHHNRYLQRAWNKHGEDAFEFAVIELVLACVLLEREQVWIDRLHAAKKRKGFNICPTAGSRYGTVASDETRVRLRISHLGKALPESARQKLREFWTGRRRSEETNRRISAAKMGHTVSEETRAKIRATKTGRTFPPETYANRMKTCIVTDPEGNEYVVHGVRRFCREHGLDQSTLMRVAEGKQRHHKGWKCRWPEPSGD